MTKLLLLFMLFYNCAKSQSNNYSGIVTAKENKLREWNYVISFNKGIMDKHILIYSSNNNRKLVEMFSDENLLFDVDSTNVNYRVDTLLNNFLKYFTGYSLHFDKKGKVERCTLKGPKPYFVQFGTFTNYYPNGSIYCQGIHGLNGYIGYINYYNKKGVLLTTLDLGKFEAGEAIFVRDPYDFKKKRKIKIFIGDR